MGQSAEGISVNEYEISGSAREAAEDLWIKVLNDFNNETMHQQFIDFCTTTHQLPLAGEKYKAYREEKGDTPLIEKYMKRIVISAQYHYLPDREGRSATQKGSYSRLLTSMILLVTGVILILLWVSFPAIRIFLLMILVILLGYIVYRVKGKV